MLKEGVGVKQTACGDGCHIDEIRHHSSTDRPRDSQLNSAGLTDHSDPGKNATQCEWTRFEFTSTCNGL